MPINQTLLTRIRNNDKELTCLSLHDQNLTDRDLQLLGESLQRNTNIRTIMLINNEITYSGIQHLLIFLKFNSSIDTITIMRNNIGDNETQLIVSHIIERKIKLRSLSLEENRVSNRGAICLSEVIKNDLVEYLYLMCNNIGDEGAKALAEATLQSSSIRRLELQVNRITDRGLEYFIPVFSKQFEGVRLYSNLLSEQGVMSLLPILPTSRVSILEFYNEQISPALCSQIDEIRRRKCYPDHLCPHLEYKFKDSDLLKEALTRQSAVVESRSTGQRCYQRLEILGDAVLHLALTDILYEMYPTATESELHDKRVWLERNDTVLPEIAQSLEIDRFLIMGKGEQVREVTTNMRADAMEAIFGAIYKDSAGDMNPAKTVIRHLFAPYLTQLSTSKKEQTKAQYTSTAVGGRSAFSIRPT